MLSKPATGSFAKRAADEEKREAKTDGGNCVRFAETGLDAALANLTDPSIDGRPLGEDAPVIDVNRGG